MKCKNRYGAVSVDDFDATYRRRLKQFHRQYPYYDDLSEIEIRKMERTKTFVGNGPSDIKPKNARIFVSKGLAEIVEGPSGKEILLTKKGERYLDKLHRLFEDMLDSLSS